MTRAWAGALSLVGPRAVPARRRWQLRKTSKACGSFSGVRPLRAGTARGPEAGGGRAWLALAFVLGIAALGTGCRIVKSAAEIPGQTVRAVTPGRNDKGVSDPADIQQKLLRFANEFSAQMIGGIDKLRWGTNVTDPAEALQWKIWIITECCSIASGQNALANLLDMTVFVTAVRITLEDYWQPRVFGVSAQPMLEMARSSETNLWGLTGTVLNSKQQDELRHAIIAWRQEHPVPENVLGAPAASFATEAVRAKKTDAAAPGSVFGLLGLDPLSGLDPATREIALTRMFAERALFVTQWMPTLLRWQVERMILNAMTMPQTQQLIANYTQITASVDRFARVAEQLPGQISVQREALLKALEAQEGNLTPLVNEVRQTITAGSQMSSSLNTMLTTFDALMNRFGVGETNTGASSGTNSEPFRILDYSQTATRLEAAARQLTELVRSVDQTLGSPNLAKLSTEAAPVIQSAQSAGKEIVDYAFWKGTLLVAIVLVAALIYRFLAARLMTQPALKQTHHD